MYKRQVLDTAAGMGAPFEAAAAVADRALLVITPDPVALRDGHIVCDALAAGGLQDIRLVINQMCIRDRGSGGGRSANSGPGPRSFHRPVP